MFPERADEVQAFPDTLEQLSARKKALKVLKETSLKTDADKVALAEKIFENVVGIDDWKQFLDDEGLGGGGQIKR